MLIAKYYKRVPRKQYHGARFYFRVDKLRCDHINLLVANTKRDPGADTPLARVGHAPEVIPVRALALLMRSTRKREVGRGWELEIIAHRGARAGRAWLASVLGAVAGDDPDILICAGHGLGASGVESGGDSDDWSRDDGRASGDGHWWG